MRERSAVIKIFYEGEISGDFAIAVLRSLNVTLPDSTDPMTFLLDVVTKLEEKHTLVVEVDTRFGSKRLEDLLLLMKRFGDDLQLVQPVVILSSSRAALTLEINASSLRA